MGKGKKKNNKPQSSGGGPSMVAGGIKITDKTTNKKAKVAQAPKPSTSIKKHNLNMEQASAVVETVHKSAKDEKLSRNEAAAVVKTVYEPMEDRELPEGDGQADAESWDKKAEDSYDDLPVTQHNTLEKNDDNAWLGKTTNQQTPSNNRFGEKPSSAWDKNQPKTYEYANKGARHKETQHGNSYNAKLHRSESAQIPSKNKGRFDSSSWSSQTNDHDGNTSRSSSSSYQGSFHEDDRRPGPNKKYNQNKGRNTGESSGYHEDNEQSSYENKAGRSYNRDNGSAKQNRTNWDDYRSPNRNNENSHKDKEFGDFEQYLRSGPKNYVKVHEIDADLFGMSKEYSLAHCVAEDMNMGSGIAVQFSQQFKRRDELYQQKQKQGGLAILTDDQRFIYYLVTKKLSNGKPTMYTLWCSLQKMQKHVDEHKVAKLAIPRIGCGLDRLEWSQVKAMLEYTFRNTDVEITVCNFQQSEDGPSAPPPKSKSCSVANVAYPLVDIEAGTAIIYFGSEDGHVTEEIERLDTKFQIMQDYKTKTKKVGDVLQSFRQNYNYGLYGFIIKKSKIDPFNFVDFQKCVNNFRKVNTKKDRYYYVGIQAFLCDDDDLIINRIVNILRHSLYDVEIYVCWGGKMAPFMPQYRRYD